MRVLEIEFEAKNKYFLHSIFARCWTVKYRVVHSVTVKKMLNTDILTTCWLTETFLAISYLKLLIKRIFDIKFTDSSEQKQGTNPFKIALDFVSPCNPASTPWSYSDCLCDSLKHSTIWYMTWLCLDFWESIYRRQIGPDYLSIYSIKYLYF